MPRRLTQSSHIQRQASGVYHYRRRLPGMGKRQVTLSLATRGFREAEHRAEMLDRAFDEALGRVMVSEADEAKLAGLLREELRRRLNDDVDRRLARKPGEAVYAYWWAPGDDGTADAADLVEIQGERSSLKKWLPHNSVPPHYAERADELLAAAGLPNALRPRLITGLAEVDISALDTAERRTLGTEAVVFHNVPKAGPKAAKDDTAAPKVPQGPLASALVEPHFTFRQTLNGTSHQVIGQERGTVSRFLEFCGDRPVAGFNRGDVTGFLAMLRRLPKLYGKAPKDRDRPLSDIIAEADAVEAPRVQDRTVKRHLSALAQFFQFALDQGHLSVAAKRELVDGHRFRDAPGARDQRDMWTSDHLAILFASPVWTGCHPHFRSQPGPEIIRDAKFWLPLLALFHGARLEEFADLYRRDIGQDGDVRFVALVEADDRSLKNNNATRNVPLHPEVIRLGFLDYVADTAPGQDDPLFPDLIPQGKDKKRGPRITRWFVEYRRAIGIYRAGVGMHAFRHTARTRLTDVVTDYQQERHIDALLGHGRTGGEGQARYDKGPQLRAVAETLALLRFPELDLSKLFDVPHAA